MCAKRFKVIGVGRPSGNLESKAWRRWAVARWEGGRWVPIDRDPYETEYEANMCLRIKMGKEEK